MQPPGLLHRPAFSIRPAFSVRPAFSILRTGVPRSLVHQVAERRDGMRRTTLLHPHDPGAAALAQRSASFAVAP